MKIEELDEDRFLQEMKEFLESEAAKIAKTTKVKLLNNIGIEMYSSNPSVIITLENEKCMGSVGFWSSKTGDVVLINMETESENFEYGFCVKDSTEAKEHAQKVLRFFEKS